MPQCGKNGCTNELPPFAGLDVVTCACGARHATGLEKEIRRRLEGKTSILAGGIPGAVAARAASYCTQIYKYAKSGRHIGFDKIERKIRRKYGTRKSGQATQIRAFTRSYGELSDSTTGAVIVEVWHKGTRTGDPSWRYIYVVFRGSVGAKRGMSNPLGAGVTAAGEKIDWLANFDNAQAPMPWGGANVRVHKGFLEIYNSISDDLVRDVRRHVRNLRDGRPPAQVIVTGHSLGSALATLCAFDLTKRRRQQCVCLPICPPRVGNLHFVSQFNSLLSTQTMFLRSEQKEYRRCYSFVQRADLVSILQKRSFQNGIDRPESKGRKVANWGGAVPKGVWASRKTTDELNVYYHVQNIIAVGTIGLHMYQMAEAGIWNWTRG